jgi:hypothetical protein
LARWYATPGALTFVGRIGRGGAKSHTSVKISLNETLFGNWQIPPGERHFWAYVSKTKDEATQRLALIERLLADLGIDYARQGDEIALRDLPRGWRVFAATIGAVSGFRCFGYSADELAKWQAGPELANPAVEVCGSLNAMTITHPAARRVLISSPLGSLDYHFERFEQGNTTDQIVAHAPSWVANPAGITEEQTRKAEPNATVWRREYPAIPQANYSSAFDPDAVARALGRIVTIAQSHQAVGFVDLSSGRGDACAFGVASWCVPVADHREIARYEQGKWVPLMVSTVVGGVPMRFPSPTEGHFDTARDAEGFPVETEAWRRANRPVLVWHTIDAIEGRFNGKISGSDLVAHIARLFHQSGVREVIGDQREEFFARSEFARHKLEFRSLAWTSANKTEAITRLNRLFGDDAMALPDRPKLRRELLSYVERVTPSGSLTYSGRGAHDDEVSLLITCAIAELERLMPGSSLHAPNYRTVVGGR